MKKNIKIIISLLFIVMIFCGALIYTVSEKINTKEIEKITIENIEKLIPNTTVSIGKVDYSLGSSIRVYINELKIIKKDSNKDLFIVRKLITKFPLLTLITGKGSVDLNLEEPEVLIHSDDDKTNWHTALAKDINDKKNIETSVLVPTFFKNSKINLKVTNAVIKFNKKENKSSIFLEKILFKNFNLTQSTAFEIVSKVDYKIKNEEIVSNIQIIGEVEIGKFVKKNLIDANLFLEFKNTQSKKLNITFPLIKQKLKIISDSSNKYNLEVDTNIDSILNFTSNIDVDKNIVSFTNVDLSIYKLKDLLTLFKSKVTDIIHLNQNEIKISGNASYDKKTFVFNPQLAIKAPKEVELSFYSKKFPSTFEGTLMGNKLNLLVQSSLLNGTIITELTSKLNKSRVEKINLKSLATNLELFNRDIQKEIYFKIKGDEHNEHIDFNLKLEGKNILIDGKEMNIDLSANSKNGVFEVQKSKFTIDKSLLELNQNHLTLSSVQLRDIWGILPPFLAQARGIANGNILYSDLKEGKYSQYHVKITKGSLNYSDFLIDFDPILKVYSKKIGRELKLISEFDSLSIQSKNFGKLDELRNTIIDIKNSTHQVYLEGNLSKVMPLNTFLKGSIKFINHKKIEIIPIKLIGTEEGIHLDEAFSENNFKSPKK